MQVSRSGYYSWKHRGKSKREMENERLVPIVLEANRFSKSTYGTRRMSDEVQESGSSCGRYRARTLMNMAGVKARQKKKFKVTTDSKHKLPVAPNLLQRQFTTAEPNQAWVSDITYIWTSQGWLYLAVVLDLFSRQIVGWAMSNRINKKIVIDSLLMGIWSRNPDLGLIFHTDQGSQYCSKDFQKTLKNNKMVSSMSRKGNCWDNAVAESFFGSLKTERVFLNKYKLREEARKDIFDYIEIFYNNKRRHSYLGNISPKGYEKLWEMKKAA